MELGWLEELVPAITGAVDEGREGRGSAGLGAILGREYCSHRRGGESCF